MKQFICIVFMLIVAKSYGAAGSFNDLFHIGKVGSGQNVELEIGDIGSFRYNFSTSKMQVTHDGSTYTDIGSGGGSTGISSLDLILKSIKDARVETDIAGTGELILLGGLSYDSINGRMHYCGNNNVTGLLNIFYKGNGIYNKVVPTATDTGCKSMYYSVDTNKTYILTRQYILIGGANSWIEQALGNFYNYGAYGNGLNVVVGTSLRAAVSSDGLTWTASTISGMNNITDIVYGNGAFIVVGNSQISRSVDGITWTKVADVGQSFSPTISKTEPFSVAYGNGLFVAVGQVGDGACSNPIYTDMFDCQINGGTWIYEPTPFLTSPDGITWTKTFVETPKLNIGWFCIDWYQGFFIATGGAEVSVSEDGIIWKTVKEESYSTSINKCDLQSGSLRTLKQNDNKRINGSNMGITIPFIY